MPELDFTQYVILAATIAGVVELITRVRAKDWWAVVTIVSAAFVGFLFGLFHYYPDLDAVEGMVAGVSVSGVISAIGFKRSTPAPSDPIQKA
jgi:hypothetical protein